MNLTDNRAFELVVHELAEMVPGLSVRTGSPRTATGTGAYAELRVDGRRGPRRRTVAISVKTMSTLRVEDLLGRLAVAVLALRGAARERNAIPLAAVVVPTAGPKTWETVETFMATYAPDVGWAILDQTGSARVVIPPLKVDVSRRTARRPEERQVRRGIKLFSDLNSWMLKILLLHGAPPQLWGGPRIRAASPTELHRIAGVSVEAAHRFARTFEARDFMRRDRIGLRLVRQRELLDLWRAEVALRAQPPVPVRWVLGRPKRPHAGLEGAEPPDLVVGGFDACRRLGVLHASASGVDAHALQPIDAVLTARGLELCAAHEADLRLLRCPTPQSVLRGSVVRGGVRVVDAMQAALDVAHHPERGREQFDYIIDQVLHLGDER